MFACYVNLHPICGRAGQQHGPSRANYDDILNPKNVTGIVSLVYTGVYRALEMWLGRSEKQVNGPGRNTVHAGLYCGTTGSE